MGNTQIKIQLDPAEKLAEHIAALDLESPEQYQQWCSKHGFGTSLKKRNKMLAAERSYAATIACQAAAERRRLNRRPTKDLLPKIADGSVDWRNCDKPQLQNFGKLVDLFRRGKQVARLKETALLQLLNHLNSVRSKILRNSEDDSRLAGRNSAYVVETLVLVAAHHADWIRPIDQWKPRTRNARRQLRSLLRHLFDQYHEIPEFMDAAWASTILRDGKLDPEGQRLRKWYLHIGQGRNLRDLKLPIAYTKKMAHFFAKAPNRADCLSGTALGASNGDERQRKTGDRNRRQPAGRRHDK